MTTSPSNTRALRPTEDDVARCPFCHSANFRRPMQDAWQKWLIGCADCGAEGPQAETPAEAIEAWNTRVPDPALVEALREAREALRCTDEALEEQRPFEDLEACCSIPRETEFEDELLYQLRCNNRHALTRIDTTLSQLNPEAGDRNG